MRSLSHHPLAPACGPDCPGCRYPRFNPGHVRVEPPPVPEPASKPRGTALVYPARQRCMACRQFFGFLIVRGLFDSYECAGMPAPSRDPYDAPRSCRTLIKCSERPPGDPRIWRFKIRFDNEADARATAGTNPLMNAYLCDYCGAWHVGHAKTTTEGQA